jgi:A/G-specific adenine glycosylase
VCTPNRPACSACPIAAKCYAHLSNAHAQIPVRAVKKVVTKVEEVAVVLRKGEKVLLAQRPATGRWAEMWEFPHTEMARGETSVVAAVRLLADLGIRATLGAAIVRFEHTVTRFRITLMGLEARYHGGKPRSRFYRRAKWLAFDEIADLPVSSPQRRLVAEVRRQRSEDRGQRSEGQTSDF